MRTFILILVLVVLVGCGGTITQEAGTPSNTDKVVVATMKATESVPELPQEPTSTVSEPTSTLLPTATRAPTATSKPVAPPPDPIAFDEDMGYLTVSNNRLILDPGGCSYGGTFERIEAVDRYQVIFNLCRPDPAFPAKVAFGGFGIQSAEYLLAGEYDPLLEPVGTGPYRLENWSRGERMELVAFENYWGEPPKDPRMVIQWATEGPTRLAALQRGEVDWVRYPSPSNFSSIESNPDLTLLPVVLPNTSYLGINNRVPPFDQKEVRQALAMGIDRQRIVDKFFLQGLSGKVATHFTPCAVPGGCEGDSWYTFDLETARQLLADAGYPDGFETTIYYRDVSRNYLPDATGVATELQQQLEENLGITANIVVMESGEFLSAAGAGTIEGLYLSGWRGDYPDPTNFLGTHFSADSPQFGDPYPSIYEPLAAAALQADSTEAADLYATANNAIREAVPMIPLAHGATADAALATAVGARARTFGVVPGWTVDSADDTFTLMQSAEPLTLACADEIDGETLNACGQIFETLLSYALDSGRTVPGLATDCTSNRDVTEWTCQLREGVTFHNGATFDANDVVMTFAVGLDATNPLHDRAESGGIGNTGVFEYWSYFWGRMAP